jgi:hypothetical protein
MGRGEIIWQGPHDYEKTLWAFNTFIKNSLGKMLNFCYTKLKKMGDLHLKKETSNPFYITRSNEI